MMLKFGAVEYRRVQNSDGSTSFEIDGRRHSEGPDIYEQAGSVFMKSSYPGQPDRAIAGPAKSVQDVILTVVLLFAAGMLVYQVFNP